MRRIGIDVGGTSTDAVLVDGDQVVATIKVATTTDVMSGVEAALRAILADPASGHTASIEGVPSIGAVMIGTTQFTNAVVERAHLAQVGAIRICLPSAASLPPMVDWPADLRAAVDPRSFLIAGGHEVDGRPIAELDRHALRLAAEQLRDAGIRDVAITAVFSPLTDQAEVEAADIVREIVPNARITVSSTLGRIGLLERENVTMLNAALGPLSQRVIEAFQDAVTAAGLAVPLYITQNDGTVVTGHAAAATPVFCFASGPTNSMRGAALLSGIADAIVVDVGGTTSDIGALRRGFPRQANNVVQVGGVRTLFRMPDLVSLALGGGSIVDPTSGAIGPRSVGHGITDHALVFGGATLTATDVAVAAGLVDLGDADLVRHVDRSMIAAVLRRAQDVLERAVDEMKESGAPVDLVAVGGGAFLVPDRMEGVAQVHRVAHAGVANAVGAAMAQVSGEVDQVASGMSRARALAEATELAVARAVAAGANADTVVVVDSESLPLSYLPGDAQRIYVRVIGEIAV